MRRDVLMTALIAVLLTASGACADQILVGAPNPNNFSAWDTQSNVPPSGPVFLFADEFSISSTKERRSHLPERR
jgi:hypothetical protein